MLRISKNELAVILNDIRSKYKLFLFEMDGDSVQSWFDYISQIEKGFNFPTSCVDNIDGYMDWIRDLSWLDYEAFVIVIKNASSFMKNDLRLRNEILSDFTEEILPFWESEVERVMVCGEKKLFKVLLVNQ